MVRSEKAYSPFRYLKLITRYSGCIDSMTSQDRKTFDIEQLGKNLRLHNYYGIDALWDYPLTEIDHVIENDISVVLVVDCKGNARWFEVPEDCDPGLLEQAEEE